MNKDIQGKLAGLTRELVQGEGSSFWLGEADLLINAGMNLQSMDVRLCKEFELKLGPLSIEDKIAGIAEFHRQALEAMNLPVPDRGIHPDPLRLSKVHEMPPFRGVELVQGGDGHRWSESEIDELMKALLKKRPELIAHYEADLDEWIKKSKPDGESRSQTAGYAIESFVLTERPDIDSMDAGMAVGRIVGRISSPFHDD